MTKAVTNGKKEKTFSVETAVFDEFWEWFTKGDDGWYIESDDPLHDTEASDSAYHEEDGITTFNDSAYIFHPHQERPVKLATTWKAYLKTINSVQITVTLSREDQDRLTKILNDAGFRYRVV